MGNRPAFSLSTDEMEDFGSWLSMDLVVRSGHRGRRQKQAMTGMFCSRPVVFVSGHKRPDPFHGSDFSFRIALLVLGWHRAGMPVLEATEKVASDYSEFLKSHLGKGRRGRRPKLRVGDATEIDETVRTIYYKFRKAHPEIDALLEIWLGYYVDWCNWIGMVDRRCIDAIEIEYRKRDQPHKAALLESLARKIRRRRRG